MQDVAPIACYSLQQQNDNCLHARLPVASHDPGLFGKPLGIPKGDQAGCLKVTRPMRRKSYIIISWIISFVAFLVMCGSAKRSQLAFPGRFGRK